MNSQTTITEAELAKLESYLPSGNGLSTKSCARLIAALRASMQREWALREAVIDEAASYHDLLADFFKEQGRDAEKTGRPGFAEENHRQAATHRVYAQDIRDQVWLEDRPEAVIRGSRDRLLRGDAR